MTAPEAVTTRGPDGRRRGRRDLAVLGVALVFLVGAGGSIAWSLRQADWFRPRARIGQPVRAASSAAPPKAAVAPPAIQQPEDASERCELRIFRGAAGDPVVVVTGPGKLTEFRANYYGSRSRLAREVVRQAVLMAARDRLNLPVRDVVVGDPMPAGEPSEILELDALCHHDLAGIAIVREKGGERTVLLDKALRSGHQTQADYKTSIETAEAFVRDGLPQFFARVGVTGRPAATAGDRLPEGIEIRLAKMTFVEAFAALRQLHEAIRSDGPSTRRLEALVRAYANLGLLTEYQWDGASRAYKARALLYAQRLVAAGPKSPEAYWHRAYAATLAGLHWWGIEDLDEARRLAEARPAAERPAAPGWLPLLESWCRYDHAALDAARAGGGPDAELASLLYLMSVERPSRSGIAHRAARDAVVAAPECFRAYNVLCEGGGINALHFATTAAPEALSRRVPRRIATLPGVPGAVREAAGRPDEVAMTRALDEASAAAGDLAEPSWAALARIVRETRFVFTLRRMHFMARQWSVPTDEYWDEVRPLVAGHRFRPLLEAYVSSGEGPDLRAFADNVDTTDLDMNYELLARFIKDRYGPNSPRGLYGNRRILSDWTVHDLGFAVDEFHEPPVSVDRADKLIAISPNSPFAMATLMRDAWEQSEKKVEGWRKVVGHHPTFLAGMARHLVKAGKREDAERTLEQYIKVSADRWAYEELAKLYLGRGEGARWRAMLDEYLAKGEDYGLDHAQVRVAIAEELMRAGRYDEARPYADAAARTWAGWAMSCAQKCAEAQRDWEAAEGYARASSERYPGTMWAVWFLFCERTGHGDIASARAWTRAVSAGFLEAPGLSADNLLLVAFVQLLCGDKEKAREALRRFPVGSDDPFYVASLTAAADLADLPEARDAAIRRFCDGFSEKAPKSTEVIAMIRDAIAAKTPGKLDLTAIDKLLDSIPKPRRGNTSFSVAAHLTAAGRLDEARRYWTMVADGDQSHYWWQSFALSTLRDRYPEEGKGQTAGEKSGAVGEKAKAKP